MVRWKLWMTVLGGIIKVKGRFLVQFACGYSLSKMRFHGIPVFRHFSSRSKKCTSICNAGAPGITDCSKPCLQMDKEFLVQNANPWDSRFPEMSFWTRNSLSICNSGAPGIMDLQQSVFASRRLSSRVIWISSDSLVHKMKMLSGKTLSKCKSDRVRASLGGPFLGHNGSPE